MKYAKALFKNIAGRQIQQNPGYTKPKKKTAGWDWQCSPQLFLWLLFQTESKVRRGTNTVCACVSDLVKWNEVWISWLNNDFNCNFIQLSETLRSLRQHGIFTIWSHFPKCCTPVGQYELGHVQCQNVFILSPHISVFNVFKFHSLLVLETGTLWLFTLHIFLVSKRFRHLK